MRSTQAGRGYRVAGEDEATGSLALGGGSGGGMLSAGCDASRLMVTLLDGESNGDALLRRPNACFMKPENVLVRGCAEGVALSLP